MDYHSEEKAKRLVDTVFPQQEQQSANKPEEEGSTVIVPSSNRQVVALYDDPPLEERSKSARFSYVSNILLSSLEKELRENAVLLEKLHAMQRRIQAMRPAPPQPEDLHRPKAASAAGVLKALEKEDSIPAIGARIEQLRPLLEDKSVFKLVRQALRDPEQRPLQKRGLLELLAHVGVADIDKDILFHIEHEHVNEFLYACIAQVRLLQLEDAARARVAGLLRDRLSHVIRVGNLRSAVAKNVSRQAILALSTHGNVSDVDLLLRLLHEDMAYELGDQVTAGLRELLARFADSVSDETVGALHRLCRELLSEWVHPRVLLCREIFVRAAQVVEVLCARLHPGDLRVAAEAVTAASNLSLVRLMLQYVARAESQLAIRGYAHWLAQHHAEVAEIRQQLEDAVHQLAPAGLAK